LKQILVFLLQSIIVGLAAAVLVLLLKPDILELASPDAAPEPSAGPPPATEVPLAAGPVSYHAAVEVAAPAVVNVLATKIYAARINPLLRDPLFRQFFGEVQDLPTTRRDSNVGSGVIVSGDGYILTNGHLIREADEIQVTLRDGRQTTARVIGTDPDTDLAVLKIELSDLPSIPLGDSEALRVGDVVLAIGNPYGFGQTVTQGIVSATGRKRLGITTFEDFIQTDAAINPGNSGGALVTAHGELVGINTAIISNTGGSQGIGLATPANIAIDVMRQLINYGRVTRGWLGIEAQLVPPGSIPPDIAAGGVLVAAVLNGGPADQAGIMPGDIIVRIIGQPVSDPDEAIRLISKIDPGTEIELLVLRGWQLVNLRARVGERPPMQRVQPG
jgi:serine protease DegS